MKDYYDHKIVPIDNSEEFIKIDPSIRKMIEEIHLAVCGKEKAQVLVDALRDIGDGPGYPLDDCPKCRAAEKARNALNDYGYEAEEYDEDGPVSPSEVARK